MNKRCIAACLLAVLLLPAAGQAATAPTPGTGHCGQAYCYWETPMDISDPETVWNVLIQPMTVVSGKERVQVIVRAEPSEEAEPVGEVTCHSQGVHVLETLDNGWSLVECYSSANGLSRTKVYGDLICGYLPTELLVTYQSKTKYGLVVDKLSQRMYVFEDGCLIGTLRVSTGKPTEDEPQRDTNAGEFHLVSMVGDYVSEGDSICEDAIRFNDGDLIHGVPYYVKSDGSKDYTACEGALGRMASMGCIRVQRRRTPQGINMSWLWNHLFDQKRTKLIIWEDVPGRQLPIPADDTPVYVLPELSSAYHSASNCYDIDRIYFPMQQITYGQLHEAEYAELGACSFCNPPPRREALESINAKNAAPLEETPAAAE